MDFLINYLSYEHLRIIWWALIGVLVLGWAVTDGFDVGVAVLLKIIAKTEDEKRILINSIAPHWDGNQVWLITAGGAMFAAWPIVYAVSFSGFYLAFILVLMALFFRPLAFDYRHKIDNKFWRSWWDWGLAIGSGVLVLIIGVAFGNLLQGVPFDFNPNTVSVNAVWQNNINMPYYHGGINGDGHGGIFAGILGLISLLNWYAILVGLVAVLMVVAHGGAYLQLKTSGKLRLKSEKATVYAALSACVVFILCGALLYFFIDGYQIVSILDKSGPSIPAKNKIVAKDAYLWFANYMQYPILIITPIVGVLGFVLSAFASYKHRCIQAFIYTSVALLGVIFTVAVTMFPFIIPSSITPNHSLTLWDSTSSYNTLAIMTVVAIAMTPIVLAYTVWCYYKMRGRLTRDFIEKNSHELY